LINLCFEPLLQVVEAKCGKYRAFVGRAEEKINFTIHAYADGVILISRESKGIRGMFDILEYFVNWSQMEVNVRKCATA
jgi:hypothetical protein